MPSSTRPSPAPQTACRQSRKAAPPPAAQAGCPLAPSSSQNSIHQHPKLHASTRPSISQSGTSTSSPSWMPPSTRQARKTASTSTPNCMPPSTRTSSSQITFPSLLEVRTPIAFSYLGKKKKTRCPFNCSSRNPQVPPPPAPHPLHWHRSRSAPGQSRCAGAAPARPADRDRGSKASETHGARGFASVTRHRQTRRGKNDWWMGGRKGGWVSGIGGVGGWVDGWMPLVAWVEGRVDGWVGRMKAHGKNPVELTESDSSPLDIVFQLSMGVIRHLCFWYVFKSKPV